MDPHGISDTRGQRYLTVVGLSWNRMAWITVGRNKKTVVAFFDDPNEQRCAEIRRISADAAECIGNVVADRWPGRHPLHGVGFQWTTQSPRGVGGRHGRNGRWV